MLNNAWPSMIWHLYDYNLEADASYYAVKNACAPLHIQYSYDDQSIVVDNSTYHSVEGLHATVDVHGIRWNELYHTTMVVNAPADNSQQIVRLPGALFNGTERILLIDLTLADSAGHIVSRNFYWVPYTLTTFDWEATEYTYTPAERYPDLTALAHLPTASVSSNAEIRTTPQGREIVLHLDNQSGALAFQVEAAVRTSSGGLIAPVFWSDNWIELVPGESRTLTAQLPDDAPSNPIVKVAGWNIEPATLTPQP
ncbi:MAG: glycosyl hydrolase family 2, partial [Acidobacteriaceae bacterium]